MESLVRGPGFGRQPGLLLGASGTQFFVVAAPMVVREARGDHISFEIVAMDFEERGKLRKLLASLETVAV